MADDRTRTADRAGATRTRRRWGTRILLGLLALFVLGCVGLGVAFAAIAIPNPNQLAGAQASIVYYDDGTTEMARISEVNRQSVPLQQVPDHVQKALLAAEDRGFYSNSGVSPTGIVRVVWQALSGGSRQGGSTITQQYVKNYFLSSDQTVTRKFKEIVSSVKIDQQQSKDQILESYLNTIYYGRGAYGIQTAARAYFSKDVGQLTVSEGAVLASVIRGPSLYDPGLGEKQLQNVTSRMGYVLDGMVSEGWLAPEERARASLPRFAPLQPSKALTGPNGYVVDSVRKELKSRLKLTDADIDRGGLRIRTTIQKKAQDGAVQAMDNNLPKGDTAKDLYAGLVAVRPGSGAVVAMYGGKDYQARQFSSATDAVMQAGSTFKPFTLIAGLQQGISTRTMFDGNSPIRFPQFDNPDGIRNFGKISYGMVDLRTATAKSINTAYMGLNVRVGPKATKDAAIAAGLPAGTAGLEENYTNVLGTASPTVLDMANAYATIAAQGTRATPYLIDTVTSAEVDITYHVDKKTEQTFGKDVAADVIDAMQQVTAPGGTGAKAQAIGRPSAGKTGTSTENKSVWWVGYVPQLSVAVGMYKDVNGLPQPLYDIGGIDELTGGSFPLSIWDDFMKAALNGDPVLPFPKRAGIGDDKATTSTTTSTTTSVPPPRTTPPTTTTPPPTTTTSRPPTTTTPPPVTTTPTRTLSPPTAAPPGTAAPLGTAAGPSLTTGALLPADVAGPPDPGRPAVP